MSRFEILEDALGKIDDDLLFDAETVRNKKKRRPIAFFAAAACLTVMLLAIPIGILIANQNEKPNVPTTSTPFTTKAEPPVTVPRPSLLDLPGATVFDENDIKFQRYQVSTFPGDTDAALIKEKQRKWLEEVKETNTVVMGHVTSHTSVLVPDADGYYRITLMTIKILQDISGVGKDTVSAVYACRYQPNANHYTPDTQKNGKYSADMFKDYTIHTEMYNQNAGVFLLKQSENQTVTINETAYPLSVYSDTVMEACLLYRIGSGAVTLTGTIPEKISFDLIEDVFGVEELKPNDAKPNPTYDRDAIDILKGPEPYKAIVKNQDGTFFTIEKHDSDNHPALIIRMDNESEPFHDLFPKNEADGKPEPNPNFAWAVVIDGTLYDVKPYSLVTNATETLVLLDLGEDFTSDKPFEQIILGIYNIHATPYSFDYFATLNQ